MPVVVGWIVWGIGAALVSWVVRVILAFGLAVVTTTVALPPLKDWLMGYVSGMPADVVHLFGYMGVDRGLSLILSALAVAAASRVSVRNKSGPSA